MTERFPGFRCRLGRATAENRRRQQKAPTLREEGEQATGQSASLLGVLCGTRAERGAVAMTT